MTKERFYMRKEKTEKNDGLQGTGKMTLEEYKQQNRKSIGREIGAPVLGILLSAVCLIAFACFFSVPLQIYEKNDIAGYIAFGVAALLYLLLIVVPVVRLLRKHPFVLNPKEENLEEAKRRNRRLLRDIAADMVDAADKADTDGWYSREKIEKLREALNRKGREGDRELRGALTAIYMTDVAAAAKKTILKNARRVALTTAISQSELLDASMVVMFETQMIKDIVFLYGFRPTDEKLAKIYGAVLTGSLTAYGAQGISNSIFAGNNSVFSGIPYVGQLIGTLTGSAAQGIVNATLTYRIGKQTQKYLISEYKLQEALDNVVFTGYLEHQENEESELRQMTNDIRGDLIKSKVGLGAREP